MEAYTASWLLFSTPGFWVYGSLYAVFCLVRDLGPSVESEIHSAFRPIISREAGLSLRLPGKQRQADLCEFKAGQAVVVHSFNPSTQEAETGGFRQTLKQEPIFIATWQQRHLLDNR